MNDEKEIDNAVFKECIPEPFQLHKSFTGC